ncbi:aromatic acid decarboxylase [Vulcanibacillus modesticaldus]|uniref:Flavin prenyltransferase UbiX n=1 Tax=Vulcanibacillus modesticaldus TaxID=337097 RepID=A0A1D2YSP6_9BACI|nr:flavin prenyltransferase UbiX [Vulcanibacillus modesticaldus]OEF97297.1 aromatic acid decarboxylase [Vulcanibacillus modesticaldus]
MNESKKIIVGITGASGVIYGIRLIEELVKMGHKVHLMITDAGWQVLNQELGLSIDDKVSSLSEYIKEFNSNIFYHHMRDFNAPIASGSYQADSMIVIPCSMGTLSKIAHGTSSNLLERAADVMLKEGKKLIIVPRETPLNNIHLENMLTLSKAGAKILPAMPGFYHNPSNIEELIDHLVGKALDLMGIPHSLFRRWGE